MHPLIILIAFALAAIRLCVPPSDVTWLGAAFDAIHFACGMLWATAGRAHVTARGVMSRLATVASFLGFVILLPVHWVALFKALSHGFMGWLLVEITREPDELIRWDKRQVFWALGAWEVGVAVLSRVSNLFSG